VPEQKTESATKVQPTEQFTFTKDLINQHAAKRNHFNLSEGLTFLKITLYNSLSYLCKTVEYENRRLRWAVGDFEGPKASKAFSPKCVFAGITNVQESVWILVFFVDFRHIRTALGKDFTNKQKYGFLRRKLDSLSYNPHELCNGNVTRYQEFSFVDFLYAASRGFFNNYRNSLRIFHSYLLAFTFSFNERMQFLELPLHFQNREILQSQKLIFHPKYFL